jgi:hypothetical protein
MRSATSTTTTGCEVETSQPVVVVEVALRMGGRGMATHADLVGPQTPAAPRPRRAGVVLVVDALHAAFRSVGHLTTGRPLRQMMAPFDLQVKRRT